MVSLYPTTPLKLNKFRQPPNVSIAVLESQPIFCFDEQRWFLIFCLDAVSWYMCIYTFGNYIYRPMSTTLNSSTFVFVASNAEKLNLKTANEYKYLRQSNCYTISGVDDAEQFRVVMVLHSSFSYEPIPSSIQKK